MEAIRYLILWGDLIMAVIMAWFLSENIKDTASVIGFSIMIFLLVASAGLIWWRWWRNVLLHD